MDYLSHNIAINLNRIRKAKGMSLDVVAEELYKKYGYYLNGTVNASFPGEAGAARMAEIMSGLRVELADLTQAPTQDAYLVNVDSLAPTKDVPGATSPTTTITGTTNMRN